MHDSWVLHCDERSAAKPRSDVARKLFAACEQVSLLRDREESEGEGAQSNHLLVTDLEVTTTGLSLRCRFWVHVFAQIFLMNRVFSVHPRPGWLLRMASSHEMNTRPKATPAATGINWSMTGGDVPQASSTNQ